MQSEVTGVTMQNAINFCYLAVNKENSHFYINNQRIYASNGIITITAPLALPDSSPKAEQLVAAFKSLSEANVTKTPTGKLSIKNGKLKALVNCSDTFILDTTVVESSLQPLNCDLVKILKVLLPFTIDPANESFKWAKGIILEGNYAYATNNAIVIRHFTGLGLSHKLWISQTTAKIMLKVKDTIEGFSCADSKFTVYYADNKSISQRNYDAPIPDLERLFTDVSCDVTIPEDLFIGVKSLKPFVDDCFLKITFSQGYVTTVDGTQYELDLDAKGGYNLENVMLLENVATHIDFTNGTFIGNDIVGRIHGYRD
jgi:hypothetical protein